MTWSESRVAVSDRTDLSKTCSLRGQPYNWFTLDSVKRACPGDGTTMSAKFGWEKRSEDSLLYCGLIWANFHLLGEWELVPASGHEKQPRDTKCKLILQKWLGIEILKIILFIKENQFVISYQLAINSECQYSKGTGCPEHLFWLQEW